MLKIYNTLTKKLDIFKPRNGNVVKMYTCGPTVYARPHIGNYRTYVIEDILKRWLVCRGYRVRHAMNITDYDSTIRREMRKTGMGRGKLTAKYERIFLSEMKTLGAMPADFYPHVSEYADQMADAALALIKKGAAYRDGLGRAYFDISKDREYGMLTGTRIRNLAGRKVSMEEYRRFQAGDFLVWEPCRKGSDACIATKLGAAKPPWNMQCAVMSTDCLGYEIDIAAGGWDNRFNHHENTRAVVRALSGKEYAAYWVHLRHLIWNGRKMSKSKGRVVKLPELAARGLEPKAMRMLLLSEKYRRRLNFTWKLAGEVEGRFARMKKGIALIRKKDAAGGTGNFGRMLSLAEREFESAMDDDLDAPRAIASAEKLVAACVAMPLSKKQSGEALALLKKFDFAVACIPL